MQDGQLYHSGSGRCMSLTKDGASVFMATCKGDDLQVWKWDRRTPDSQERQDANLKHPGNEGQVQLIQNPPPNMDANRLKPHTQQLL